MTSMAVEIREFMTFLTGLVGGLLILGVTAVVVLSFAFGPPSCHANGSKMGIKVEWSFWTGCMIEVRGTWLPWSEVVPIERDGKIVFEPKPSIRLQSAK